MSKFAFMNLFQFKNWFYERIDKYLNLYVGTYGQISPFYRSYRDGVKEQDFDFIGVFSRLESAIRRFLNHSYTDVLTMIDTEGEPVNWTYETLCDYLHEPKFLLQEEGDLKYFWGKKPVAVVEHIDRLFGELRYIWSDSVYAMIRSAEFSAGTGAYTIAEFNSIAPEKIKSEWDANEWVRSNGKAEKLICTSDSSWVSIFTGVWIDSIGAGVRMERCEINARYRFPGRAYLYGKPNKYQYYDKEPEYNNKVYTPSTMGQYPGLPDVPEWGNWYRLCTRDIEESTSSSDYKTAYYGSEEMPEVMPVLDPEDGNGYESNNSKGCQIDNLMCIYDIHPDQPTTFLP